MMRLFLDDERMPAGDPSTWVIARSFEEAVVCVEQRGMPAFVSFDNDLGPGAREGWEFARWLIERDLDTGALPADFAFQVHSQNPVRRQDIEDRLNRYLRHRANPFAQVPAIPNS